MTTVNPYLCQTTHNFGAEFDDDSFVPGVPAVKKEYTINDIKDKDKKLFHATTDFNKASETERKNKDAEGKSVHDKYYHALNGYKQTVQQYYKHGKKGVKKYRPLADWENYKGAHPISKDWHNPEHSIHTHVPHGQSKIPVSKKNQNVSATTKKTKNTGNTNSKKRLDENGNEVTRLQVIIRDLVNIVLPTEFKKIYFVDIAKINKINNYDTGTKPIAECITLINEFKQSISTYKLNEEFWYAMLKYEVEGDGLSPKKVLEISYEAEKNLTKEGIRGFYIGTACQGKCTKIPLQLINYEMLQEVGKAEKYFHDKQKKYLENRRESERPVNQKKESESSTTKSDVATTGETGNPAP